MRCPSCASENPQGLKFCEQCAAPLKRGCTRCEFENSPTARFCGLCAAPLEGVSPPPLPVHKPLVTTGTDGRFSEVPEGERKTVTALFADTKGSTELVEDLDPEEARAIIDPALKLMIEAVEHYGGYVAQSTGDGIFAMFGAPVAHEDHPQRALYAALRMQEELRRYGAKIQADGHAPVEIRVGANTGEVVVRSILTGEAP